MILIRFPKAPCYPDLKDKILVAQETASLLTFLFFPLSQITEMLEDPVNEICLAGMSVPQTRLSVEEKNFCMPEDLRINLFFWSIFLTVSSFVQ